MGFDQPLEKGTNDITFKYATDNMGIQSLGLTAVSHNEYSITGSIIHTTRFSA
jgi:hypothetical protein